MVEFTVGDNAQAGQFNSFRAGYAGTIYKGQGEARSTRPIFIIRNIWRAASSYVALTRHREHTSSLCGARDGPDLDQLARQMARVDDRRAASQFHYDERLIRRAELKEEFRERGQSLTIRSDAQDERQRKIDEVVQRLKQQRERDRGERDRER